MVESRGENVFYGIQREVLAGRKFPTQRSKKHLMSVYQLRSFRIYKFDRAIVLDQLRAIAPVPGLPRSPAAKF